MLIGGLVGGAAAWALVQLVKRYLVPDFLHGFAFLTTTLGVFVFCNWMQHESGLVTVTVLRVLLANQRSISVHHVVEFQENLRVFLISRLFVVLGSRLRIADIQDLGVAGAAFVGIMITIVRPLSVTLATWRTNLTWRERGFLAFLAPRGIVAAAVTSVFALQVANQADDVQLAQQAEQLVGCWPDRSPAG